MFDQVASGPWVGAIALVLAAVGCADLSERDFARERSNDPPSTTEPSATTTIASATTSTTLDPVRQLVFDACIEPLRTTEAGLELEAALVYESQEDAFARIGRSADHAVLLATQAAELDPTFADFAEAEAYWRDHMVATPESFADEQLTAAVRTVDEVCETVGVPTGEPVRVPDEIYDDTPERGRYDACKELIFGEDGTVYVDGERFDYSDCDRITSPALEELNHDDAFERSVELFFDVVGGPICWGEECRNSWSFSP